MFERVAKTITRYSMFAPGDRVGVAVSGGADSVFLLHALFELAPRWDLKLTVLHLDHGLRGAESAGDAEFVRELAQRFGLAAKIAACDVRALAEQSGDNLEQTGRRARIQFYEELLKGGELQRIATGHTRSDQAETVLFRFLRGSGSAGLAGIRPINSHGLVRPLIELDREEIRTHLLERGVEWHEDSSNLTRDFARNRIRQELLPAIERDWNPALVETLSHTAVWAQDEEAYWESTIDRIAKEKLIVRPPTALIRCSDLGEPAVARRLVRRAIEQVKGDLRGISFEHVERVLAMAAAPDGHDRAQAPGLDCYRSFEWIRLAPPGMDTLADRNFRFPVSVPGRYPLPNNCYTLGLEFTSEYTVGLDCQRLGGSLELRNWRPGDQYQPVGRSRAEKVKVLFQEARIPLWERRAWPILVAGDQIVWARHFGPARECAATPESRSIVRVWEEASY